MGCDKAIVRTLPNLHDTDKAYRTKYLDYHCPDAFPDAGKGLERYISLLPPSKIHISLREGGTPLVPLRLWGRDFFVKDEGRNPTGSFKDRDACVVINKALEEKIKCIHVVSAGNAAASYAAYAQAAGIRCICHVPSDIPDRKLTKARKYCRSLSFEEGSYEDIYRRLSRGDEQGCIATSGKCLWSGEGSKTIAYELWEQSGQIENIIVPCGNGQNLAFIWKGFKELLSMGKICRLPKMIGVQIKGASPLGEAIRQKTAYAALKSIPLTIASGIAASESFSSPLALAAISESGGLLVEITEEELRSAIAESAISDWEPTSVSVIAAAKKIALMGSTILIMTGRI